MLQISLFLWVHRAARSRPSESIFLGPFGSNSGATCSRNRRWAPEWLDGRSGGSERPALFTEPVTTG